MDEPRTQPTVAREKCERKRRGFQISWRSEDVAFDDDLGSPPADVDVRRRRWKLPGLEIHYEARREELPVEGAEGGDRTGQPEPGPSAGYENRITLVGLLLAAVGVADMDWRYFIAGMSVTALGAAWAMRRLESGVSRRGLLWVALEVGLAAAAIGLVVLFDLDGVWMWLTVGVAVFVAPWLATRLTGVGEL